MSERRKKVHRGAKDPNAGKVILFVVGGLSRGEVYTLQALDKSLPEAQLIIGTTGVHTAQEFMQILSGHSGAQEREPDRSQADTVAVEDI